MTRAEILADLKVMIGNGIEVSDGQLYTWINDGYGQLVDAILDVNPDYFSKSATISTVSGTSEYALASDFEKMIMVNVLYSGTNYRFRPIPNLGFDKNIVENNNYTLSDPKYYLRGNNIGLLPAPGENGTNNLTYYYSYTPTELILDSSVPAFPVRYHHLIKYWAYAVYLDRDDEHTSAERMRQRFDAMKETMKENIFGIQIDEPRSVEIVNNIDMF